MWAPMTDRQRKLIHDSITIEVYQKNETIYKETERPEKMMCLVEGKVKIYKKGMGHDQIIRVVKPFEIFGYRAYFASDDYKTTAMAFEMSTIAFIPMKTIIEIMRENFEVSKAIIRHLSTTLGNSDTRTVNLTQKHIRGRLAETLIALKDSYGVDEKDGRTLNIHLTREDLANLSNMTTSNAIRTLSSFASEGLVSIDGKNIKILQEETLRSIS